MTRTGLIVQRSKRMTQAVTLHLLTPDWDASENPEALLSPSEHDRAHRFVHEPVARRWMIFRAKAKQALAACAVSGLPEWREGPGGKPYIDAPGLDFNLSHSDRLAALIISRAGPVGVDLEPLDRAPELLECEDSFCHPDEQARLPNDPVARGHELLKLWTAKEALLKAVGTGLQHPPTLLKVQDGGGHGGPKGCERFNVQHLPIGREVGHCLAVALPDALRDVGIA